MKLFSYVADFSLFFIRSISFPWNFKRSWARITSQIYSIGIGSIPIVFLISAFLGLVTTVQLSYQLLAYLPRYFMGAAIGRMVLIELGPVLTGLIVCGRAASSMAAEVGTMRVTEQIDALEVMAIDPYRFLNFPRIIGSLISLPLLTIFSEFVAITSGAVYGHLFLNIPMEVFSYGLIKNFFSRDFFGGLLKSFLFALAIANCGCYFGFNVKGGAREVGISTTYAVVTGSILILFFDFIVALVVFG